MAFLQSEPPREPFLHAPAIVLWMIGAFAAVYLVSILVPGAFVDRLLWNMAFVPARYEHGANVVELTVPLVSHMFLHGGILHLAVNCLWFLAFAPIVARRYGTGLFLAFFFTCGIAGALTHLATNWGSEDPVIGASGGIAGLMAAGMRMLRWPNVQPWHRLAPILSKPVLMFTLFWVVTNLLLVIGVIGLGEAGDQVAWQAHLGGYFCGLFLISAVELAHVRRVSGPAV